MYCVTTPQWLRVSLVPSHPPSTTTIPSNTQPLARGRRKASTPASIHKCADLINSSLYSDVLKLNHPECLFFGWLVISRFAAHSILAQLLSPDSMYINQCAATFAITSYLLCCRIAAYSHGMKRCTRVRLPNSDIYLSSK